jgi:hypothetical protein
MASILHRDVQLHSESHFEQEERIILAAGPCLESVAQYRLELSIGVHRETVSIS